jgi:hypothetical protein
VKIGRYSDFLGGGKVMSGPSYLALIALIAMVIFYAVEDRSPVALLGFSIASVFAALGQFILGCWPFGLAAFGFAVVSLWRWYLRLRPHTHL